MKHTCAWMWEMEMNEARWTDKDKTLLVRRVPGGWIYLDVEYDGDLPLNDDIKAMSSVFVPYIEELDRFAGR